MTDRNYWKIFALISLLRLALAIDFPILSDEALHILWGYYPSLGHSDHPGMTGWLQSLFIWLGPYPVVYRISCLLVPMLVTDVIRRFLSPLDSEKAKLVAILYFLSPLSFFHLIYTPETPLLLFVFFGVLSIYYAHTRNSVAWAFVAGLCQSGAILSKYNGLWLGAAAFFFFVIRPKSRSLKLTLAYGAGCVPAFAVIAYHNWMHCWINWSRLYARMDGKKLIETGPLLGLFHQLVLGSIWGWYFYFKSRTEKIAAFATLRSFLPIFIWIPLGFFLYVSLGNKIGLHWMQAFYPFFFILLLEIPRRFLKLSIYLSAGINVLATLVFLVFVNLPLEWLGKQLPRYHHDLVMSFKPHEFCETFQKLVGRETVLATFDYSQSSTLWINCQRPVLRYGYGAIDGRDFDRITDYKQYDGKQMAIVQQSKIRKKQLRNGLVNPQFSSFVMYGKKFRVVSGTFSYETYKSTVLSRQLRKIYDPPSRGLPNDACYFKKRYFDDANGVNTVPLEKPSSNL